MSVKEFNPAVLKQLYTPEPNSHKAQNGKLLIVGGSHLFHSASLWALQVSSKIVDMVFYSSVPENNDIVQKAKEEFKNGIVVRRDDLENYVEEADCILIGPGMLRSEFTISNFQFSNKSQNQNLKKTDELENEGEQTYFLTKYILEKFKNKKFVLDAGALQMMEPEWLLGLVQTPILTPHRKEFETMKFKVQNVKLKTAIQNAKPEDKIALFAKEYKCTVLFKSPTDIVCSPSECMLVEGGNAGMTKGGTGDVLAGLAASLYCKNEAYLSALAASYINKKAGESLFNKVGYYFNASDLAGEIPKVMKEIILK
jgi:hydroxyethylthiazole kinase-like uncharacterized protein yjeF